MLPPPKLWVSPAVPAFRVPSVLCRLLAHRRADFRGGPQFAFHARHSMNRSHDAVDVVPLLARIDDTAQAHPAALRVAGKTQAPRGRVVPQSRPPPTLHPFNSTLTHG